MTRSTCMWTQDSWRAVSSVDNCFLALVNGGTLISAQYNPTLSCTLNPQSAKIWLPRRRCSKIPQLSVRSLSEMWLPQPLEINDITPCGVIPIKNFHSVVVFVMRVSLYSGHHISWTFTKKTSIQSLIHTHFGNPLLKSSSIVFLSISHSGHLTRGFKRIYMISIHFLSTFETFDCDTANLYAKSWSRRLKRNFIRTCKKCWK